MLRLSEVALFMAPFALAASWWLLGTRGRAFLWTAVGVLVVLAAATAWFGLGGALPRGHAYVPARLDGGHIVAGHGA